MAHAKIAMLDVPFGPNTLKYAKKPDIVTLPSLWNFIHIEFPELPTIPGEELPQKRPKRGDVALSPSRTLGKLVC